MLFTSEVPCKPSNKDGREWGGYIDQEIVVHHTPPMMRDGGEGNIWLQSNKEHI